MTAAEQAPPSRLDEEKRLYRPEALRYQTTRLLGRPINSKASSTLAIVASYSALLLLAVFALKLEYQPRLAGQLSAGLDEHNYVILVTARTQLLAGLRSGDEIHVQLQSLHSKPALLVDSVNGNGTRIEGRTRDGSLLGVEAGTTCPIAVLLPKRRLFSP